MVSPDEDSTGRPLAASRALLERALRVIPSASQTFSKGPTQWVAGVAPSYLECGEGAWVWDVDGNKYLDYLMALGPIILGYGDPAVEAAIIDQVRCGSVFTLMHRLEVEVAERLVELIPCAEMVRFGKTGTDVTSAAVRAARAFTGRDLIACSGYHGWQDWFIGTTTRSLGVPEPVRQLTTAFPYNDLPALRALFDRHGDDIAAVIMEPVGVALPDDGYLAEVRAITERHGALLVFDEIVTGFRLAMGGAQEHYGVVPDLACFGKAMANGMPLSAIVGRRDVMEIFDEIFFSGTFGGETLSLAACKATLQRLEEGKVIEHIWRTGDELITGLRSLITDHGLDDALRVNGLGPRSQLAFPHEDEAESRLRRSLFMQECIERGLLYCGIQMPTASHGEAELAFTMEVFDDALGVLAEALAADDVAGRLHGACVEPVFRQA